MPCVPERPWCVKSLALCGHERAAQCQTRPAGGDNDNDFMNLARNWSTVCLSRTTQRLHAPTASNSTCRLPPPPPAVHTADSRHNSAGPREGWQWQVGRNVSGMPARPPTQQPMAVPAFPTQMRRAGAEVGARRQPRAPRAPLSYGAPETPAPAGEIREGTGALIPRRGKLRHRARRHL
jgi:hypothetical protein